MVTKKSTRVEPFRQVQLYRQLLATNSLSPFIRHNSAVRQQMFSAQHLSQILVIKNPSERYIQTGAESEFGKYTFNKKFDTDVEIIRVVHRYSPKLDRDSIRFNPEDFVIYEDIHTKEVGVMVLTDFCCNHQYFGFRYVRTEDKQRVSRGNRIKAGTVIMESPNVTKDGGYMYGKQVNVALMTLPGTSEDSIIVSDEIEDDFTITTFEHRVAECGRKRFPRNLYGKDGRYQPFPEIGDYVRDDGLIAAFGSHDDVSSFLDLNVQNSDKIDYFFDRLVYANGPGGRVIDIRVFHDPYSNQARCPEGTDQQLIKYDQALRQCYEELVRTYNELRSQRGESLVISEELQALLVRAIAVLDKNEKQKIQKLYRLNPIDDWRIEFVIEYNLKIAVGNKLTDTNGKL